MTRALAEVARMIQRESGIALKPSQLTSLRDAIARVDRDLTPERLLDPHAPPDTLEHLIDEIAVRETYFFRHRAELDAIDWHAMLAGARARGTDGLRVWVAGCASGEEAFTVAILACEAFATAVPPVRVLATDIASSALRAAVAGQYGRRAIRSLDDELRHRYFIPEAGEVRVGERLRALVEFRRHNLVRDPIPPPGCPPFDIVLCRNVLIYFDRATVERVIAALERALTPAGVLVLGAADRLSGQGPARPPRSEGVARRRARTVRPSTTTTSDRRAAAGTRRRAEQQPAQDGQGVQDAAPATIASALQAADRGKLEVAVNVAETLLASNPLDARAHYIRGVVELARDAPRAAVEPLRRALYVEPNFSLAAFKLARAHDRLGEAEPARRAYQRTLRTLDRSAHEQLAPGERLDLLDVTAACHARLRVLGTAGEGPKTRTI